jgi:hypothetical protein
MRSSQLSWQFFYLNQGEDLSGIFPDQDFSDQRTNILLGQGFEGEAHNVGRFGGLLADLAAVAGTEFTAKQLEVVIEVIDYGDVVSCAMR